MVNPRATAPQLDAAWVCSQFSGSGFPGFSGRSALADFLESSADFGGGAPPEDVDTTSLYKTLGVEKNASAVEIKKVQPHNQPLH